MGSRSTGLSPVHMQFANAWGDDQLLSFVTRWGPLWGDVEAKREGTLPVRQHWEPLRREQKLFSNATRLLAELGKRRPDVRLAAECVAKMAEHRRMFPLYEDRILEGFALLAAKEAEKLPWITFGIADRHLSESHPRNEIIRFANLGLCHLLDRYPPILVPHNGRVDQLPKHRPEGILPTLYFMLREDYMLGRQAQDARSFSS